MQNSFRIHDIRCILDLERVSNISRSDDALPNIFAIEAIDRQHVTHSCNLSFAKICCEVSSTRECYRPLLLLVTACRLPMCDMQIIVLCSSHQEAQRIRRLPLTWNKRANSFTGMILTCTSSMFVDAFILRASYK